MQPKWINALNTQPAECTILSDVWYGSRCVPQLAVLLAFFVALRQQLESCAQLRHTLREHIEYHNLFSLYAYVATEFATGLRPCLIPPVNTQTVDARFTLFVVADKDSTFTEERVSVLPSTVQTLLRDVQKQANPSILTRLRTSSRFDIKGLQKLDGPLIFFVDPETKSIHPLEPSRITQLLDHYPSLRALWPFPPNVHRHYIRSRLFNHEHIDFDFELINFFMGHKHFCHEPFHSQAWSDMPLAYHILSEQLELCLSEIGIIPLRFQP